MRTRLRALASLPLADLPILCRVWILLLVVDLGLRLVSLQRIQAWTEARGAVQPREEDACAWTTIERLHRLTGVASRHHLYRMNCLQRSLALQRLLNRRGIGGELRIGVRKNAGVVHAHAWLEVAGQPVGESDTTADEFLPLEPPGQATALR